MLFGCISYHFINSLKVFLCFFRPGGGRQGDSGHRREGQELERGELGLPGPTLIPWI